MNAQQQQQLDRALDATLIDGVLSKAEEQSLRDAIEVLAGDRQGLAFIRNRAYRKARERIERSPTDTLRWLEKIDKIVDNTVSPPEQGGKHADCLVAFSPGEMGLEMIMRELRDAKRSLDICVFTITDNRISDTIIDAHRSGIAVRIITDNDKQFDDGSDIARMVRADVPTRFDPDTDHMHHKFAIVDGQRLITGSYNWTRGATRNHENVTVLSEQQLVESFVKEFNHLWSTFRPWRS
ncbi:MAG: phospholipase D-like domain-containing protein [Phycisphaeraceae bacterium]